MTNVYVKFSLAIVLPKLFHFNTTIITVNFIEKKNHVATKK